MIYKIFLYEKRQVFLHLSDLSSYTTAVISSLAEMIKIFKIYFSVDYIMITTTICMNRKSQSIYFQAMSQGTIHQSGNTIDRVTFITELEDIKVISTAISGL